MRRKVLALVYLTILSVAFLIKDANEIQHMRRMPKEVIVEQGVHPHPGPQPESRRAKKTGPEDPEEKRKMRRRIEGKVSVEEHIKKCTASGGAVIRSH